MPRRGILLLLLAIAGCQSASLSGWQFVSSGPEAEALAGRAAAPLLERQCGGLTHDPAAQQAMEAAGRRLLLVAPTPGPCQYALLATAQINAYSLPGGLIYLTRGLYQRIRGDEELMAAAIAHEAAHIVHRDSLKPECGSPREAMEREIDADLAAARRMAAAGYAASAMLRLLEVTRDVQPPGWAEARAGRLRRVIPTSDSGHAVLASR